MGSLDAMSNPSKQDFDLQSQPQPPFHTITAATKSNPGEREPLRLTPSSSPPMIPLPALPSSPVTASYRNSRVKSMVGVIVREDDDGGDGYQGGMDERMRVEDFDFDVQGGEDVGGDEIGRRDERVDKENNSLLSTPNNTNKKSNRLSSYHRLSSSSSSNNPIQMARTSRLDRFPNVNDRLSTLSPSSDPQQQQQQSNENRLSVEMQNLFESTRRLSWLSLSDEDGHVGFEEGEVDRVDEMEGDRSSFHHHLPNGVVVGSSSSNVHGTEVDSGEGEDEDEEASSSGTVSERVEDPTVPVGSTRPASSTSTSSGVGEEKVGTDLMGGFDLDFGNGIDLDLDLGFGGFGARGVGGGEGDGEGDGGVHGAEAGIEAQVPVVGTETGAEAVTVAGAETETEISTEDGEDSLGDEEISRPGSTGLDPPKLGLENVDFGLDTDESRPREEEGGPAEEEIDRQLRKSSPGSEESEMIASDSEGGSTHEMGDRVDRDGEDSIGQVDESNDQMQAQLGSPINVVPSSKRLSSVCHQRQESNASTTKGGPAHARALLSPFTSPVPASDSGGGGGAEGSFTAFGNAGNLVRSESPEDTPDVGSNDGNPQLGLGIGSAGEVEWDESPLKVPVGGEGEGDDAGEEEVDEGGGMGAVPDEEDEDEKDMNSENDELVDPSMVTTPIRDSCSLANKRRSAVPVPTLAAPSINSSHVEKTETIRSPTTTFLSPPSAPPRMTRSLSEGDSPATFPTNIYSPVTPVNNYPDASTPTSPSVTINGTPPVSNLAARRGETLPPPISITPRSDNPIKASVAPRDQAGAQRMNPNALSPISPYRTRDELPKRSSSMIASSSSTNSLRSPSAPPAPPPVTPQSKSSLNSSLLSPGSHPSSSLTARLSTASASYPFPRVSGEVEGAERGTGTGGGGMIPSSSTSSELSALAASDEFVSGKPSDDSDAGSQGQGQSSRLLTKKGSKTILNKFPSPPGPLSPGLAGKFDFGEDGEPGSLVSVLHPSKKPSLTANNVQVRSASVSAVSAKPTPTNEPVQASLRKPWESPISPTVSSFEGARDQFYSSLSKPSSSPSAGLSFDLPPPFALGFLNTSSEPFLPLSPRFMVPSSPSESTHPGEDDIKGKSQKDRKDKKSKGKERERGLEGPESGDTKSRSRRGSLSIKLPKMFSKLRRNSEAAPPLPPPSPNLQPPMPSPSMASPKSPSVHSVQVDKADDELILSTPTQNLEATNPEENGPTSPSSNGPGSSPRRRNSIFSSMRPRKLSRASSTMRLANQANMITPYGYHGEQGAPGSEDVPPLPPTPSEGFSVTYTPFRDGSTSSTGNSVTPDVWSPRSELSMISPASSLFPTTPIGADVSKGAPNGFQSPSERDFPDRPEELSSTPHATGNGKIGAGNSNADNQPVGFPAAPKPQGPSKAVSRPNLQVKTSGAPFLPDLGPVSPAKSFAEEMRGFTEVLDGVRAPFASPATGAFPSNAGYSVSDRMEILTTSPRLQSDLAVPFGLEPPQKELSTPSSPMRDEATWWKSPSAGHSPASESFPARAASKEGVPIHSTAPTGYRGNGSGSALSGRGPSDSTSSQAGRSGEHRSNKDGEESSSNDENRYGYPGEENDGGGRGSEDSNSDDDDADRHGGGSDEEEQEGDSGDSDDSDDVPLAQRHPTALKAQKSLRETARQKTKSSKTNKDRSKQKVRKSDKPGDQPSRVPTTRVPNGAVAAVQEEPSSSRAVASSQLPPRNPFAFSPDELSRKWTKVKEVQNRRSDESARMLAKEAARYQMTPIGHSLLPQTDAMVRARSKSSVTGQAPPLAPFVQNSVLTMSDDEFAPAKQGPRGSRATQPSETVGRAGTLSRKKSAVGVRPGLAPVTTVEETTPTVISKSTQQLAKVDSLSRASSTKRTKPLMTSLDTSVPVPSVTPPSARPTTADSSESKIVQRVFVAGTEQSFLSECSKATSAIEILKEARAKGLANHVDQEKGGLALWEIDLELATERPLREFEPLSEVIHSWLPGSKSNSLTIRRTHLSPLLSLQAAARVKLELNGGFAYYEVKPGKWSKRWMELRNQSIFLAKSDAGKDDAFLCSLSNFDVHLIPPAQCCKIKPPKAFAFAVKSTDPKSIFENAAQDYIHYFSVKTEEEAEGWFRRLSEARSSLLFLRAQQADQTARSERSDDRTPSTLPATSSSQHSSAPSKGRPGTSEGPFQGGTLLGDLSASRPDFAGPPSATTNPGLQFELPDPRMWNAMDVAQRKEWIASAQRKARQEGKTFLDFNDKPTSNWDRSSPSQSFGPSSTSGLKRGKTLLERERDKEQDRNRRPSQPASTAQKPAPGTLRPAKSINSVRRPVA